MRTRSTSSFDSCSKLMVAPKISSPTKQTNISLSHGIMTHRNIKILNIPKENICHQDFSISDLCWSSDITVLPSYLPSGSDWAGRWIRPASLRLYAPESEPQKDSVLCDVSAVRHLLRVVKIRARRFASDRCVDDADHDQMFLSRQHWKILFWETCRRKYSFKIMTQKHR